MGISQFDFILYGIVGITALTFLSSRYAKYIVAVGMVFFSFIVTSFVFDMNVSLVLSVLVGIILLYCYEGLVNRSIAFSLLLCFMSFASIIFLSTLLIESLMVARLASYSNLPFFKCIYDTAEGLKLFINLFV